MGDQFSGYPRNLSYSVKSLSSFSKQTVRLTPDNDTNIAAGSTIKVKLPPNCLVDLRTFTAFFEGSISTTGGKAHFPRLSSSLIEQLSIYVNGTMIENIPNYNVLYNTLFDLQCGSDQTAKRNLENIDPSVDYDIISVTSGASTNTNNTLIATANDTAKALMVNNWLGFLGSASTPVISTSDTSTVEVEIRFAPSTVLWCGGDGTTTVCTGANYTISKLRFTISKIVFNDPTYYQLKAAKLLSDGLVIGYKTYITNRGSVVNKATSLTYSVNVNSSSLDQVIATMLDKNYTTISPLLLAGAGHETTGKTFQEVLALQTADAGTVATKGDLFNQSVYFRRNAMGLTGSSFEINNTMMNPYPLPIEEVYNETLIALGNQNIDMSAGCHPGLLSAVCHFPKYYFAHILSLENLDNSGQFFKSGLDGRAAALNISWKTSFTGTTDNCTPFIFCAVTKLLQINEGGQVTVIS